MICQKDLLRMVLFCMKKVDNFSNCLRVLKNADFELADSNEIYRTGVIGQFNLTFITAFVDLEKVLEKKVEEADESWES